MSNENDKRESLSDEENDQVRDEQSSSADTESTDDGDTSVTDRSENSIADEAEASQSPEEAENDTEVKASETGEDISEAQEAIVEEAEANTIDSSTDSVPTEGNKDDIASQGYGDELINPTEPESNAQSTDQEAKQSGEEDSSDENDEQEEEEQVDYSTFSKQELVDTAASLSKMDHYVKADNILKEIAPLFNKIVSAERSEALERFKADGGDPADFSYRDEDQQIFDGYYKIIKERKSNHFANLEKQKEENYKRKLEVLEKLRLFVDGEENTTSINTLKALQEEWKAIGPIPGQHNQTLWANYHAIIDRFYDHRSIYFELKELDRKKNLKKKLALCEKAEALAREEDFKKATSQLNELHEEFKHIGPIPREQQDQVWERFKAASDVVYANRKEYLEKQKGVFEENLKKKQEVIEKVKAFKGFDSDRINDWNSKTKEILQIQKEWEAIGGIPRDRAKAVNKEFWGTFKGFFHDKGIFFKKLEAFREENLEKKNELVEKANEIKDSEDWHATADALKKLQRDWKEIGPVPEKHRNEVYERFRAACDHFFNRKRGHDNESEKEFVENLEKKKQICADIKSLAAEEKFDPEKIYELVDQYAEIGFVPRKDIRSIKSEFDSAIKSVLNNAKGLSDEEIEELKINLQLSQIKSGPDADRKLNRKENTLKRRLSVLEDNVSLWQNNLQFFANSKNADKLRADFEQKIEKAQEDIDLLRKELKIIRQS